jgi:uncharacterized cupin superfamily protein
MARSRQCRCGPGRPRRRTTSDGRRPAARRQRPIDTSCRRLADWLRARFALELGLLPHRPRGRRVERLLSTDRTGHAYTCRRPGTTTTIAAVSNLYEPEWVERTELPLQGRTARVGALAGAERLGATLYEIDPGQNGSPFHLHHANEELIIVLSGRPTLRTLDGSRRLEPGDVVACPVGRAGAHQLQRIRRTLQSARSLSAR